MSDFPKLIRLVRHRDGSVSAYIGNEQLWFLSYDESYSGGRGHTISLVIPAEHFQFNDETVLDRSAADQR